MADFVMIDAPLWLKIILGVGLLTLTGWLYARWLGHRFDSILPPKDVEAPPSDALAHDGIHSKVLRSGSGDRHPTREDVVAVHYTGWTTDGQMFDSSVVRGIPATFPVAALIEGWQRGVVHMVRGESRRLWVPAALAYGEESDAAGKPAGMLVFDVELLAIGDEAIEGTWREES